MLFYDRFQNIQRFLYLVILALPDLRDTVRLRYRDFQLLISQVLLNEKVHLSTMPAPEIINPQSITDTYNFKYFFPHIGGLTMKSRTFASEPPGKKQIGIWIRVSTEDQARGDSPQHHKKWARFYAESKDWRVREVYHLEATSGKSRRKMLHSKMRQERSTNWKGHHLSKNVLIP